MRFNYLKNTLISLAIFAASLVFTLVLIEGILVFFSSGDKYSSAFTNEFHKKYVRYNKYGYRDYEYSLQKPQNVFRVLVLGDSQTFGHGIKKLEDNWVKKLEARLRK